MIGSSAATARGLVIGIAVVVFGWMLVEARRAASNERRQRARGGIEPDGDVYAVMQVAYPLVFVAMIAEGLWRGGPVSSRALSAGVLLLLLGKALKWWAIVSLGSFWTFRVIVVPGSQPVEIGPYRFLRHPNYLGVVGELVGVALMTDARVSGPVGGIAFSALMLRRIVVENRARDAILRRT